MNNIEIAQTLTSIRPSGVKFDLNAPSPMFRVDSAVQWDHSMCMSACVCVCGSPAMYVNIYFCKSWGLDATTAISFHSHTDLTYMYMYECRYTRSIYTVCRHMNVWDEYVYVCMCV